MSEITFGMKYWWDGVVNSTRTRNTLFCWNKLKDLTNEINKSGVMSANCKLYDFSPAIIEPLTESIHIPYDLGEYKKAEKNNHIIKACETQFLSILDGDVFISETDYDDFINNQLPKIESKTLMTVPAQDIPEQILTECINMETYSVDYNRLTSKNRQSGGGAGSMGGFFIIDKNIFDEVGMYNESFKTWGGEDGEMMYRIESTRNYNVIYNLTTVLYHLDHYRDYSNKLYWDR